MKKQSWLTPWKRIWKEIAKQPFQLQHDPLTGCYISVPVYRPKKKH